MSGDVDAIETGAADEGTETPVTTPEELRYNNIVAGTSFGGDVHHVGVLFSDFKAMDQPGLFFLLASDANISVGIQGALLALKAQLAHQGYYPLEIKKIKKIKQAPFLLLLIIFHIMIITSFTCHFIYLFSLPFLFISILKSSLF
jgi:hypothetical protein